MDFRGEETVKQTSDWSTATRPVLGPPKYRKGVVKLERVPQRATKEAKELEQLPGEGRQRDGAGSAWGKDSSGEAGSSLLIPKRRL